MGEFAEPEQHSAVGRLLMVVLGLIVYGSLYPFSFLPTHNAIFAWVWDPGLPGIRDAIVNLAIYFPVGALLYWTVSPKRNAASRVWIATLLGVALSASLECLQAFDQGRVSSLLDLLFNGVGTAAGAWTAWLLSSRTRAGILIAANPAAFAVVTVAILAHIFPFFPRPHAAWAPFQLSQALVSAADWLVVRCALTVLLQSAEVTRELALLELAIPARLFILDQTLPLGEVTGGLLALMVGHFFFNRTQQLTCVMLASVVVRELLPFNFQSTPQTFHVIPFETLLQGPSSGAVVFLNKLWLYGSLLWVWDPEARYLRTAGLAIAGLVAILEWMQRYLPGRTPDITDSVIVLLAALTLATLQPRRALATIPGCAP